MGGKNGEPVGAPKRFAALEPTAEECLRWLATTVRGVRRRPNGLGVDSERAAKRLEKVLEGVIMVRSFDLRFDDHGSCLKAVVMQQCLTGMSRSADGLLPPAVGRGDGGDQRGGPGADPLRPGGGGGAGGAEARGAAGRRGGDGRREERVLALREAAWGRR